MSVQIFGNRGRAPGSTNGPGIGGDLVTLNWLAVVATEVGDEVCIPINSTMPRRGTDFGTAIQVGTGANVDISISLANPEIAASKDPGVRDGAPWTVVKAGAASETIERVDPNYTVLKIKFNTAGEVFITTV